MAHEKIFQHKQHLKPTQIYAAAVGIVEDNPELKLSSIIVDEVRAVYGMPELARVYFHQNKNRYYVIAAPANDQNEENQKEPSLTGARELIDEELKKQEIPQEKCIRLSILSQHNKREHYMLLSEADEKVILKDPSLISYGLENFSAMLKQIHPKRKNSLEGVKNGNQKNNWSCGHHTLVALKQAIYQKEFSNNYQIDEKLRKEHLEKYYVGMEKIFSDYQKPEDIEEENETKPSFFSRHKKLLLITAFIIFSAITSAIILYFVAPLIIPALISLGIFIFNAALLAVVGGVLVGIAMALGTVAAKGLQLLIQCCCKVTSQKTNEKQGMELQNFELVSNTDEEEDEEKDKVYPSPLGKTTFRLRKTSVDNEPSDREDEELLDFTELTT